MTTRLDALDTTVQKTNIWLKDIMAELGWEDRHRAYVALRGVLHTLRDRLTVDEAVEFGAQLPLLIRGIYFEGWKPAGKPVKYNREEFLSCVWEQFNNDPTIDVEKATKAVFKVISKHIDEGEIEDVKGVLPRHLRELWE